MRQQQLLLVILVTIIVGIAIVVAINIFGTPSEQANRDAVRQDLMDAAAHVQGLWARPGLMDGAARDFSANGPLTHGQILQRLGIPANEATLGDQDEVTAVVNDNGIYTITNTAVDSIILQGEPASGGENIQVIVCRDGVSGNWLIEIDSPTVINPCN